jgi:hypothetical protein
MEKTRRTLPARHQQGWTFIRAAHDNAITALADALSKVGRCFDR